MDRQNLTALLAARESLKTVDLRRVVNPTSKLLIKNARRLIEHAVEIERYNGNGDLDIIVGEL